MSKKWGAGPTLKEGVWLTSVATDPNDGSLKIYGGYQGNYNAGQNLDVIQTLPNIDNAEWEIDPLFTLPRQTSE